MLPSDVQTCLSADPPGFSTFTWRIVGTHRKQASFCFPFLYWEIDSFFFSNRQCSHQSKERTTEINLGMPELCVAHRTLLYSRWAAEGHLCLYLHHCFEGCSHAFLAEYYSARGAPMTLKSLTDWHLSGQGIVHSTMTR